MYQIVEYMEWAAEIYFRQYVFDNDEIDVRTETQYQISLDAGIGYNAK